MSVERDNGDVVGSGGHVQAMGVVEAGGVV